MRVLGISTIVIIGLAAMAAAAAAGCGSNESTCEELGSCPPATGQDASSEQDGAAGAEGGQDADGGIDGDASKTDADTGPDADGETGTDAEAEADAPEEPACDTSKSPSEQPCLIDDPYGVFVSPSGADSGSCGAKGAPCKTLGTAIGRAKAEGKRLYACGDGGTYAEQVTIDATLDGLKLYGGFKCSDWSYDAAAKAKVKPSAAGLALSVKGLTTGLLVEDFGFEAMDGANAGDSSIAAIVEGSAGVVLRRVTVQAGAGVKGADGTPGVKGADGDAAGAEQNGKPASCTNPPAAQLGGSWDNSSACGSLGGLGGTAAKNGNGGSGNPGTPDTHVSPPGVDNKGDGSATIGENASSGKAGSNADSGEVGTAASSAGGFSVAGYSPAGGGSGVDGYPGQGGGGGGASKAAATCIGASGGAGGMGGCGGTKGTGGGGGGASVALIAWQSAVTLDGCTLLSAKGGDGGNGAPGGDGGIGKPGGTGGTALGTMGTGGPGGQGGNGGPGGSGAGGTGGPSYALVYKGDAPVQGTNTLTPGQGGTKGTGAQVPMFAKAPDGSDGLSAGSHQQP
ncbi:MAG: hypothetical protein HY898_24775 [Deltaproteobacteria bacterium]|nr:hypothetical protein [Deltaproteobacteria bacterium]